MQVFKNWNELNEKILELSKSQVTSLENANIYYSKNYESFEKMAGGGCIYIGDERAVIVLAIRHKCFFSWGMFPSEPLYFDKNVDITEDYERSFLDDVMSVIKPQYVSWLDCSGTGANFKAYPTKSERIPFGNYIIDLTQKEDTVYKQFSQSVRKSVRRAGEENVSVVNGGIELLDDLMLCDLATRKRSELSLSENKIRKFYENYLIAFDNCARIYIVLHNNKPQAAVLFLKNSAMSYSMYGGRVANMARGANNLLYWEAMRDFKKEGVNSFSFVGARINVDENSKYYNIQRFKKSFGGSLIQGFMFKDTSNSFMYKLFKLAIKLRHPMARSKGDIIDQEIHKWSELNYQT